VAKWVFLLQKEEAAKLALRAERIRKGGPDGVLR